MASFDTDFLECHVIRLEEALNDLLQQESMDSIYEILRRACVKEFETIVERCGSLLLKRLRPFFSTDGQADGLSYRDVFRYAAQHGLITVQQCERWLNYWDHGDDISFPHGEDFPQTTLPLLRQFIEDARELAGVLSEGPGG